MSRRRVDVTPRARADLRGIVAWYSDRLGSSVGRRVNATLQRGLKQVGEVDLNAATREDLPDGHFRVVAKEHLILFVMRDDVARIVRIIHGARDVAAVLQGEDDSA